jgi:hypothetical protein
LYGRRLRQPETNCKGCLFRKQIPEEELFGGEEVLLVGEGDGAKLWRDWLWFEAWLGLRFGDEARAQRGGCGAVADRKR